MKRSRQSRSSKKLKEKHSPMLYFMTIAILVVLSSYSHIQFREDVQDQAFRAVASDIPKTIQFSQLNESLEPSEPENLKAIAVEAKKGKKHILPGDPR